MTRIIDVSGDPALLYESEIDGGPVMCTVTRTGARTAVLELWNGGEKIYAQADLSLAYGAQFGPDVNDVAEWQQIALDAYDAWKATQP